MTVASNLAASAVVAAMSILFVPVYVHVLGIEAYGLIGFFASVQVLLALLDLGLGASATRELARLSANTEAMQGARRFTRTLEVVYWLTATLLAIALLTFLPGTGLRWLNLSQLSTGEARQALALMAIAFAARWPFSLYSGALLGLDRQPLLNRIKVASEVLRAGGGALVLLFVSPTLTAFLAWQIAMSAATTVAGAAATWRVLPASAVRARFDWTELQRIRRYMIGVGGIAVTAAVLTQMDKIILSRLLGLEQFGYYVLAWTIANALIMLIAPVFSAYFPSLARAVAMRDEETVRTLYHRASQVMAGLVLPVGVTFACFSYEALRLWTQDPILAENAHVVLSILLVGTMVNGLMNVPYALLLAYGWTSLAFYANLAAIAVLLPLVIGLTKFFGPVGAAFAWLGLNAGHMVITQQILHRRILPAEKMRWYFEDTLRPALLTVLIAGTAKMLLQDLNTVQFVIVGTAVTVLTAAACIGSLRHLRDLIYRAS